MRELQDLLDDAKARADLQGVGRLMAVERELMFATTRVIDPALLARAEREVAAAIYRHELVTTPEQRAELVTVAYRVLGERGGSQAFRRLVDAGALPRPRRRPPYTRWSVALVLGAALVLLIALGLNDSAGWPPPGARPQFIVLAISAVLSVPLASAALLLWGAGAAARRWTFRGRA